MILISNFNFNFNSILNILTNYQTIMNSIKTILGVGVILLLLGSCDNTNYHFKAKIDFDNATWKYSDTTDFEVMINDTLKRYNIGLNINHSKDYLHQNIYLRIHTKFPDGKRFSQRVNIDLADKSGKWYGKSSGNSWKVETYIQKDAFFNQIGKYTFTIEQFTRNEHLENINNLTFYLEDTGMNR
jgi:gliding motility-associated lipoprotein GldH